MAKIGLLSDSHGAAERTAAAAQLLVDHGAEVLIHLGDIESEAVIDALMLPAPGTEEPVEVHVVFGNVDWDRLALARYATDLGMYVDHPVGSLRCGKRRVTFLHGHDRQALRDAIATGADYVVHGHTHEARDDREGEARVINPGALHRASDFSVALLDTEADRVQFLRIPKTQRHPV